MDETKAIKIQISNFCRINDSKGVNAKMNYFYEFFGELGLHVKPINRQIMINMPCRIKAWSQMTRKLGIISFAVVDGTSLLDVGDVVYSVSVSNKK